MIDVLFFDWAVLVATVRFLAARRQTWCDYFVDILLSALSCSWRGRGMIFYGADLFGGSMCWRRGECYVEHRPVHKVCSSRSKEQDEILNFGGKSSNEWISALVCK